MTAVAAGTSAAVAVISQVAVMCLCTTPARAVMCRGIIPATTAR